MMIYREYSINDIRRIINDIEWYTLLYNGAYMKTTSPLAASPQTASPQKQVHKQRVHKQQVHITHDAWYKMIYENKNTSSIQWNKTHCI